MLHPGLVEVFVALMAPVTLMPVAAVIYARESPSTLNSPFGGAGTRKVWLVGGVDFKRRWLKRRSSRVELIGRSHFFEAGEGRPDFNWRTGDFIDGHLRHMILFMTP